MFVLVVEVESEAGYKDCLLSLRIFTKQHVEVYTLKEVLELLEKEGCEVGAGWVRPDELGVGFFETGKVIDTREVVPNWCEL